jgi:DNA primase large subunit
MEYAKHPIEIDYQPSGNLITIEDFLTRFNINIEEMLKSEVDVGGNIKRNSITRYVPVKDEFMKEIIPQPCIQSAMSSQNPPHLARFATVAWLNEIGFDKKWIFDFFYERNYIDRDASVIAYQINNIVAKGYKFPKCKNLFEEGLCVGDVCPNYNNLVRRMKTNDEKSKQCGDAGMHESAKAAC